MYFFCILRHRVNVSLPFEIDITGYASVSHVIYMKYDTLMQLDVLEF